MSAPHDDVLLEGFDLEESVSFLLRRAHARAEGLFARIMDTGELTPRQLALVLASHQNPGSTVADLAERIAVDRNTAAEMVPRLVARGLLRRERSATDGRAWAVFATPETTELLARVLPHNARLMDEILAPLPEELRPLFIKCLKLMTADEPALWTEADEPTGTA